MKKKPLSLLLLLLLTSCSLFRTPEENAYQLAIDTAVAYFTYNYQHPDEWMEGVQDEFFYKEYISQVLPTLAPYMTQYFLISTAELESIEEVARGVDEDGNDVIAWRLVLHVTPAWPEDGPPAFRRIHREDLPWTDGETATLYALAANRLGIWNLRLLSVSAGEERVAGLVISPQEELAGP